jgi:hypothetical protein
MQNVPPQVKTESLRVRLIRGETADSATLEELSEVLGMSPGGEVDPARTDKVHKALSGHLRDGLIEATDTGVTRPIINTFHLHTVSPYTGQKKWPVFQVKVYKLDAAQLSKVKHLLLADGLWSIWGDRLCHASTEGLPSVSEQAPNANTHVPFQPFKKFAEGKWRSESTLDNVYKYRTRSKTYAAAFNKEGTVNVPKFIEIATSRGEWADGGLADGLRTIRTASPDFPCVTPVWGRP